MSKNTYIVSYGSIYGDDSPVQVFELDNNTLTVFARNEEDANYWKTILGTPDRKKDWLEFSKRYDSLSTAVTAHVGGTYSKAESHNDQARFKKEAQSILDSGGSKQTFELREETNG